VSSARATGSPVTGSGASRRTTQRITADVHPNPFSAPLCSASALGGASNGSASNRIRASPTGPPRPDPLLPPRPPKNPRSRAPPPRRGPHGRRRRRRWPPEPRPSPLHPRRDGQLPRARSYLELG
jgi:hypothetical protein